MSTRKSYEIAFELGASMNSSMRSAFNNASRALGDTQSNVVELNKSSGILNKSLGVLGTVAASAGAAFVAVATGIGIAANAADDYNAAMKQVESASNVSFAQMKEIKEISKNLYADNFGEDWNDVAESISTVKSVTKLAGEELRIATENAIAYRDVWGEEVSQSIKAADTMVRNFGISNEYAFNLLAQGAKKGLNKSDELIDSANEYAPYFKTLGFSANQMFDVFSAGLESGAFNLDKVGDAVKEFNIRAKDGSKTSTEAFQALNMNASKMSQTFAKGGPNAQKAFQKVVKAIAAVKDPVKQNAIAVGLFGTQAEDLEMNVLKSMGSARSQFDMTRMTMEQIKNIKYDTLGNAFKGIKRQAEVGILIPIGQKVLPLLTNLSKNFAKNMPQIEGFVKTTMSKVGKAFSSIAKYAGKFMSFLAPALGSLMGFIAPILTDAVTFVKGIISQILTFWNQNGAQIIQAVKNVFSGISKVVQFLAPVVFFILNSVWQNVKGVIQGALNIILGLVKIFASLFTGDWAGLWAGVKQLLGGALQFLWNLWNLLLVGKLLGSLKAIGKSLWGFFAGIGKSISTNIQYYYYQFTTGFYKIAGSILQTIFKVFGAIFNILRGAVMNYIQVFQMARTFGVNIFMSIVSAVRNVFVFLFTIIKSYLTNTFSTVFGAAKGFFSSIWSLLTALWSNVVKIFGQLQYAMISPFSTLKSIVSTVVSSVRGLISGLFQGVAATGRGAINGLIMAANSMINGINGLKFKVPDWVPKIGGNSIGFSIPNIPMLAKGGITTGPTLAMIGEGAEQEAVLPLSKLEGLLNTSSTNNQHNENSAIKFEYNPSYHLYPGVDLNEVKRIDKENQEDFARRVEKFYSSSDRLSFRGGN